MLRSRLLLPADTRGAQDAAARAEALRALLVGRAGIGAAADWLEGRAQLGHAVFARGRSDAAGHARRGRVGDLTALLRAWLVALALPDETGAADRVPQLPFWTVGDAVLRIRQSLSGIGAAGAGLGVFLPRVPGRDRRCRAALASTLVGGLELARDGAIVLAQERAFGEISVRRGEDG